MATLTSTDATGQVFDQATAAVMRLPEFSDVSIVANEHFNPTDISVDAQMSHVRSSQAQVIMAWTTGTPFGTIARSAKQFVPDLPVVTTAGNTTHVLAQYASVLPQELYEQQPPFIAAAVEQANVRAAGHQMATALGKTESSLDAQTAWAWDAAMLVRAALTARGVNATADQLRSYLAQLKSFPGACGLYNFTTNPQRGLGLKDQVVARWQSQTQGWVPVSQLGGDPLKQIGLASGR